MGVRGAHFHGPRRNCGNGGREILLTTTVIVFDSAAVIEHNPIVLK
jgi:hypothetical protein